MTSVGGLGAISNSAGHLDGLSEVDRRQRELYSKQQQLLREQRAADQEKLLACIGGVYLVSGQSCIVLQGADILAFDHGQ